jgi:transposase
MGEHLKSQIPVLHHKGFSVKEICHLLSVKKSLVYQVLDRYKQCGVVSNICNYSCAVGCPCSLSQVNLAFLSTLLDHRKSFYLDELQDELWLKRGVHTTISTLHCALQQLGISRKTISGHAYERNEIL